MNNHECGLLCPYISFRMLSIIFMKGGIEMK